MANLAPKWPQVGAPEPPKSPEKTVRVIYLFRSGPESDFSTIFVEIRTIFRRFSSILRRFFDDFSSFFWSFLCSIIAVLLLSARCFFSPFLCSIFAVPPLFAGCYLRQLGFYGPCVGFLWEGCLSLFGLPWRLPTISPSFEHSLIEAQRSI